MTTLSIGVLAHNEEATLPRTLSSLARQSAFANGGTAVSEIIIVANGCTDRTASSARQCLRGLEHALFASAPPRWQVIDVAEAGKANAWNIFVHTVSDRAADYLVLMDADIEFLEVDTLASMQALLDRNSDVWIAVDRPVKDVLLNDNKAPIEHLSAWAARISGPPSQPGGAARLCGQLYAGRASILRKLWLPRGLPTEDGFLYTMIATDGLSSPARRGRVVRAQDASHLFKGCVGIPELLHHERWLIAGSAISHLVYADVPNDSLGLDNVGNWIRKKNEADPYWIEDLIDQNLRKSRWWIIPRLVLMRRFIRLKQRTFKEALSLAPVVFLMFFVDLFLAVLANSYIQRYRGVAYWRQGTR